MICPDCMIGFIAAVMNHSWGNCFVLADPFEKDVDDLTAKLKGLSL